MASISPRKRSASWNFQLAVMLALILGPFLLFVAAILVHKARSPAHVNAPANRQNLSSSVEGDEDPVFDNSIVIAEGHEAVRQHCAPCHSLLLVAQNRNSRDGWAALIDWMQETQNLWDLGEQEPVILDYLAAHYGPRPQSRRPNLNLEAIQWYPLFSENR